MIRLSALSRRSVAALCAALWLLTAGFAGAVQPEEQLDDPALEARAREISKELRCVVCDNQSIDDSNAQIAGDMRRFVRKRLAAGDTDEEVIDQIVVAYGEYVLLRPRFSLSNALIWAAPLIALIAGLVWMRSRIRSGAEPSSAEEAQDATPAAPPLAPEEEARLREILSRGDANA